MLTPARRLWLVCALMLMVAGCQSTAAPDPGPGASMSEITVTVDGTRRTADLVRPARLSAPAPLVIMLHGGGGNSANAAMMSEFSALAVREGFMVAYPNGSGRTRLLTWNAGHCCAYAMREEIDDVGFISALIDELVARGVADPRRVYVTGMSNGAMMSFRIGRELSSKVAAIAPVVGAMFGDEPMAASPVATMIVTGALDERVPFRGGYGNFPGLRQSPADAPYAPAQAALEYWLETNRCSRAAPVETGPVLDRHEGIGCRAPVVWYHLREGTHSWPGGRKGYARGDEPVDTFDASEEIWAFFSRQTLVR